MVALDRLRTDDARGSRAAAAFAVPGGIAVAAALTLATTWPLTRAVLAGDFGDPDDAMRLVEVRAWMAGQSWFDLGASRLDPPLGASMHWSRLVDVPNALLLHLFSFLTPNAEAWDRVVLPSLLLVALYAGMARLAIVLVGRGALASALLGTFLTGVTLATVEPGRIGHHGPETVALVWAVAEALAGLEAGKARRAVVAGALVALDLAMSLETLPFLGTLCAGMLLLWVARGGQAAAALRAFSLGLGGALPLLFLATVDPRGWWAPVCDAFGAAHLGAFLIVAGGGLVLAAATRRLSSWRFRLAGAAAVGGAAALFVAVAFPTCLGSPFAGVDPLVRDVWLDHVTESLPFSAFVRAQPALGCALALPVVFGTASAALAALSLRGLAAARFALVAALGGVGFALACWQIRVFATVAPLALGGAFFATARLREHLVGRGVRRAGLFATAAIVPFTATGWALALPFDGTAGSEPACLAATALRPLAGLPAGRVVAPVDAGSHLLEATPHAVFAAPYHRNNDGNRFALDVFLAPPARAQALLAARHVDYVMACPGLGETARLAARAPDSLAAMLVGGSAPGWLRPVPLAGTPIRVYAVEPHPPSR